MIISSYEEVCDYIWLFYSSLVAILFVVVGKCFYILLSNQDLLVTQIISTYTVKPNLNWVSLCPECWAVYMYMYVTKLQPVHCLLTIFQFKQYFETIWCYYFFTYSIYLSIPNVSVAIQLSTFISCTNQTYTRKSFKYTQK